MVTDPRLPLPRRWNNAELYGEFAALWFFLMTKNEAKPTSPLPEWPSLHLDYRDHFGFAPRAIESGKWSDFSTLRVAGKRT